MAFVAPVLIALLLGTFTSAIALNDNMQLTHATREGARYGATVPDDEVFEKGSWAENVRAVVVDEFGGDILPSAVCVAFVTGSPAVPLSAAHTTQVGGGACHDDSGSGVTGARVQVTARKGSVIETGLYSYDLDLSSEAIAKHESNG